MEIHLSLSVSHAMVLVKFCSTVFVQYPESLCRGSACLGVAIVSKVNGS